MRENEPAPEHDDLFVIQSCGKTDTGRQRESNQDSIYLDAENGVFVLADGMGGHKGGEKASRIATQVAGRFMSRRREDIRLSPGAMDSLAGLEGAARLTKAAVLKADEAVVKAGNSSSGLSGMGSTIETMLITGDTVTIGHVGDSRAYRLRGAGLELITEDHSMINEIMKLGDMTREEAERYPFKGRITRALGHLPGMLVDLHEERIERGDLFLLCSDGLTNVVPDERIRDALMLHPESALESVCDELIHAANEGGGPDNISAILVHIG